MLYLICLILGIALIFIGTKTRGRGDVSGAMAFCTFIGFSVQVPGLIYHLLKAKYSHPRLAGSRFVFDLFDRTTWNGVHYFL